MKITKRNGIITLYDDEKLIASILRANTETAETLMDRKQAAAIADQVFLRLTAGSEIISTDDVRRCVDALLREQGFTETARHYMEYRK